MAEQPPIYPTLPRQRNLDFPHDLVLERPCNVLPGVTIETVEPEAAPYEDHSHKTTG